MKRDNAEKLAGCLLILCLGLIPGRADYSVDLYKIAAGGGVSDGGFYSLSGTIGQTDSGSCGGGDYVIQGGFWPHGTRQQPPAPTQPQVLSVAPTLSGAVLLSWPFPSAGYVLEEAQDLTATDWELVPFAPVQAGARWQILLPVSAGNRFYRLRLQE